MGKGSSGVKTPSPSSYIPMIEAQADVNRLDTNTPWGSISYDTEYIQPAGPTAEEIEREWLTGGDREFRGGGRGEDSSYTPAQRAKARDDFFNSYPQRGEVKGETTANYTLSPELQSLFDKQFDPNAYENRSTEYMDRYNTLLSPIRAEQADRFQQSMFDRGLPEGGDIYGDLYRETVGDPNARQDIMAAQQASEAADMARLQDYNRLASAMGLSTIQVPQIDTMGPANMSMNANMANARNATQANSDMWNAGGTALGMYAASLGSSKDWKEDKTPVDTLGKLESIPVERWKYKDGIADGAYHIGPYAEDFQAAFDVGDGKTISVIDALGVLMRSVQELTAEVRELKCQQ